MSELDRELRAALNALAGDSEAAARKVVQRLGPPPTSRRPSTPWLVLGAAAAGLATGWLLRPVPRPAPAATPVAGAPAETPFATVLAARGLRQDERPLDVLDAVRSQGSLVVAAEGHAELRTAGGARLRLGPDTAVTVAAPDRFVLGRGRLWLQGVPEGGLGIEHPQGTVAAAPAAEIDLQARGDRLVLAVLAGEAELEAAGGTRRRLRDMQRIAVDDGLVGDREYVYWRSQVQLWQLDLLCGPRRLGELREMVAGPLAMLESEGMAELAETVLREIGRCVVPFVLEFLDPAYGHSPQARRRAAGLLADLADLRVADGLLALLGDDDPRVRVAAYRALVRASTTKEGSEEFWMRASPERRADSVRAWRALLAGEK